MEKKLFKDGILPDFGEEIITYKNGSMKLNDLHDMKKFDYSRLKTEEQKQEFFENLKKQLTVKKSVEEITGYFKIHNLTIEEVQMVLRSLQTEHQNAIQKVVSTMNF